MGFTYGPNIQRSINWILVLALGLSDEKKMVRFILDHLKASSISRHGIWALITLRIFGLIKLQGSMQRSESDPKSKLSAVRAACHGASFLVHARSLRPNSK
jgi:hypothetical protein